MTKCTVLHKPLSDAYGRESEIQNRPGEVTELGRRHAELQRRGAGRSGRDGKQSEAKEQNVQKDIGENR